MTLKDDGIGKISANTPFDASKVAALLPGFEVDSFTSFQEGKPFPVLRITRNTHEIMIISPSEDKLRLGTLSVMTPAITSAGGHRIGEAYSNIYPDKAACRNPEGELKGKTLCPAPGSEHIFFLFASSGTQQPQQHAVVEEMLWKP